MKRVNAFGVPIVPGKEIRTKLEQLNLYIALEASNDDLVWATAILYNLHYAKPNTDSRILQFIDWLNGR